MDPETDRIPLFGALRQKPISPDKKRPFDRKDRWLAIPSIRGCNLNGTNPKTLLSQDESYPLITCFIQAATLAKNLLWRTDSESPCKISGFSPLLKPLTKEGNFLEKHPHKPQITNSLNPGSNGLTLKLFKSEIASPGVGLSDKLNGERNVKTLNPRMLGQKLDRLDASPVLDKKGGSPLLRSEINAQRKIPFDSIENCESIHLIEKDRSTLENHPQMPEIHLKNISDRRNSCTKYPNQEEERKKSSLKSRFIDAKTQEAELGRRLLPQESVSDKRKFPADLGMQKQIFSTLEQESIGQVGENMDLSKKSHNSPLYELRRNRIGRGGRNQRVLCLEESVNDQFDQISRNLMHCGVADDQDLSTSCSKESSDMHKSTSVDCNYSFILRKEIELRKSSSKNLSISYSSNNSENSGGSNQKSSIKESGSPMASTERDSESLMEETCRKEQDEHKGQYVPVSQGLFPSNNNTIAQPVFKERKKSEKEIKVIEEEGATEEKNNHSGRSSLSDSSKKENEKFGKIVEWKMGDFIGCGSHGEVYKAMEIHTGRIIAVKKMMCIGSLLNESIDAELSILQKLKHENIVQYLGHEVLCSHLYIYMEHVAGGSLPSIYNRYGPLHEKTIKVYAKQILSGLHCLHENGVIHKDIKGANILIHKDGTVKLSDFGCSSEIERTLYSLQNPIQNGLKGSVPWMAPEVVKETGFGRRSDIWSFGCTILEMATGKCPWSQYNFENQITLMMKIALSDEIPAIPETLSEELKDFIRLCLRRDRDERPYAADLLTHKFLKA